MVTLLKTALIVFVLCFVSFSAFNPADYLYPQENGNQLTTTNFSANGQEYSLVSINSNPLFLLKEGEPVRNSQEIETALFAHFRATAYPTQSEIDSLRQSIEEYNLSRNNGGRFKGKEEYACRDVLLLNGNIKYASQPIYCDSEENCTRLAQAFYSASYAKGIKKNMAFESAVRLITEYGNASYGNDNVLTKSFFLVDSLNENNIGPSLNEIKSSVTELNEYKAILEDTIFRTPTTDPDEVKECIDEKCFAICPDISFNATALDLIESKSASLITKSQPLSSYKSYSVQLYNTTLNRLDYRTGETKAGEYAAVYEPLAFEAGSTLVEGQNALSLFKNESLLAAVTRLEDLTVRINQSILTRNFSTIEDDLVTYETSITEVKELLPFVLAAYNSSVAYKNDAHAVLFVLDTKELDLATKKKVDELKSVTNSLDAQFSSSLTGEQLTQMHDAYKNVSVQARAILKNQREGVVTLPTSKFRAFARRINTGVADLLSSTKVIPLNEVPNNKLASFGGMALFVFLSLGSLSFFIFLVVYSRFRKASSPIRFAVVGAYLLFVFVLLGVCALLYLFLDKTALASDIEEFSADLNTKKTVYVAIDLQGASSDAVDPMKTCGNSIASNLRATNKSISIYELRSDGCTVANSLGETTPRTSASCVATLKNSSAFILRYAATPQKPMFSSIYDTKAFITGDAAYYRECTIATIFR